MRLWEGVKKKKKKFKGANAASSGITGADERIAVHVAVTAAVPLVVDDAGQGTADA